MRFVKGAKVVTADGQNAGGIDRVVMNPVTKEVTHIVISKGFLFPEDRVVPVELFSEASEDDVMLTASAKELENLPRFEETHYVYVDIDPQQWAAVYYRYPPIGVPWNYYEYPLIPYVPETERNVPEGEIVIREGEKVMSADDRHVGDVEQVIMDPDDNRATHLVISTGLLLKEKKIVPVQWVREVDENGVHVAAGTKLIETLGGYGG